MDHNEAAVTTEVTVETIHYCASLLHVSPAALLAFVLEAGVL
jgi:hypothetical protein